MAFIGSGNGFTVSSNLGSSIVEGTLAGANEGNGQFLDIRVTQSPLDLQYVWIKIVPISGGANDFWEMFSSQKINGEPASPTDLFGFCSTEGESGFGININADASQERDEVFEIRIYEGVTDHALGIAPLFSTRFVILNDDLVGLSSNDKLVGRNHTESIRGLNGNDTLLGNGGNDILNGGAGNDSILGGVGADQIDGWLGRDVMTGGYGVDRFVFARADHSGIGSSAADIITDFTRGQDRISLAGIDAFSDTLANNTFVWKGTAAFSAINSGEVRYRKFDLAGSANDHTMIYIDTDGDTSTEMSIRLTGLYNLTASDFLL